MRILLTGSSGQVGGALLKRLPALGEVSAPQRDRLDLENPDSIVAAVRGSATASSPRAVARSR